jgi:tetratricopeptide (TPR) repeat protein
MLRFHDSIYLWALAAVPLLGLLYAYVLAQKKKTARKIGDASLVKALTANHSPRRALLKFVLPVLALGLCALALANLKKPQGSKTVTLNGIDLMLAVDVSKSMLAQDIKPNRLERAKQLLTRLVAKLPEHRIGLVVFAGHAYIQMPLTSDNNAARLYISSIGTNMVPVQGTVVGEALKMCYSSFNGQEKKYKAVVLLSDGEDHDASAAGIAAAMAEEGIVIHTVGIGSPEGSAIVDETTNEIKKDKDGNTVISKLNEAGLQAIAEKGKGTYQLFGSSEAVAGQLEQQLNGMEKRAVAASSATDYYHFFPWFLLAALLLLAAEPLIAETRRRKWQPAAAALLLLPGQLFAQGGSAPLKKANAAYHQKAYAEAAAQYKAIVKEKPGNAAAQYNLGNALHKAGQQEAAVQAYGEAQRAATTPTLKAAAFYNQGVALHKSNQLAAAIAAYKSALKLDPNDADARLNLQKALQQQKREQPKKGKEPQKPKEDPKQKEKEKKPPADKDEPPKPQPSKLTAKQAEEKLKALLQAEKNLQEKLRKAQLTTLEKPEKDW